MASLALKLASSFTHYKGEKVNIRGQVTTYIYVSDKF